MITEKELEKLIEQEATIYHGVTEKNIEPIKLNKDFDVDENFLYYDNKISKKKGGLGCYIFDLYKTKEEAEWNLEFENITRTETLSLPTWEDVQKLQGTNDIDIYFYDKQGTRYYINITSESFGIYGAKNGYRYLITDDRRNYIKACRVAKDLFLGKEPKEEQNV